MGLLKGFDSTSSDDDDDDADNKVVDVEEEVIPNGVVEGELMVEEEKAVVWEIN